MARSPREAEFDREFRGQIERFTRPLVSALRELVATPVPPEVKILAFEIERSWQSFPVHAFAMDDEAPNEVHFEPPFNGFLLPDAGPLVAEGAIDQDGYEAAGVATIERGARLLAEWFGERWHEAGGADFLIPAYISLHDSSRYYDLRERRWVEDTDIWP